MTTVAELSCIWTYSRFNTVRWCTRHRHLQQYDAFRGCWRIVNRKGELQGCAGETKPVPTEKEAFTL